MIDREEYQRLVNELWDALEEERKANSDDAHAKAQTDIIKAEAALLLATGRTDRRRRRMVVEARDLPAGSKVEASEFQQIERDCVDATPEGQVRIRRAFARHAVDTEDVLGKRLAGLLASNMLQNAKGRDGPLDGRLLVAGVDPQAGAADELRNRIVADTGYTVGVEIGAAGRIPHAMWKRAERAHNNAANNLRMRGIRIQNTSHATIKAWCQKEGPLAALFHEARRDGASGPTNRKRTLPA